MKIFQLKASQRDRWGNTQVTCSVMHGSNLYNDTYPEHNDLKLNLIQEKWTTLTNFLSDSTISALGFILDSKAKSIIEKLIVPEHRFYKTPLLGKDGEMYIYYWLHFYENHNEVLKNVDWKNSSFMKTEIIKSHGEVKINSAEEYIKLSSESILISYKPVKLKLIDDSILNSDMFIIGKLYHGVFISERMKNQLIDANISGITITEALDLFS